MSAVERLDLGGGYEISRVIRGGWQLAGGHGAVDDASLDADFLAAYDAGITVLDCADIYTGVEARIGAFRAATLRRHGPDRLARLKVHTKFVPDLDVLPRIDRAYVRSIIDRSLTRLGLDRLDLVQFHWWDYAVPGVEAVAGWLADLRTEGKIDRLGLTNFDAAHLIAITDAAPISTLQVQYSLLDRRPGTRLAAACLDRNVSLLCYGVLAGGFLSDFWLGRPAPTAIENRSLVKYRLIIEEFGGWDLFQALLRTLNAIGERHRVPLSAVAARWILDQPAVGAAIIGARNGDRLDDTLAIFRFPLDAADHAAIDAVLAQAQGPGGEVYALERDRSGPHGAIMKYTLNR